MGCSLIATGVLPIIGRPEIGLSKQGWGSGETDDLRKLLAQVREPLLEIVRQSRDFEAAYNPLLGMAQGLYRIDPPAGDRLLQDLEMANPYRDEAPAGCANAFPW